MAVIGTRISVGSVDTVGLDGDWEEPIPIGQETDLPPFPTHVLPPWLRDFVEAESTATQTPGDMAAVFALGVLSTFAAGRIIVRPIQGWEEPVNLFLAVAMDPGSRKSAVHRDVTMPVRERERLLSDTARLDVASAATVRRVAQQILRRAEKAAATTDPENREEREREAVAAAAALEAIDQPIMPRLFAADVTPEALGSLLSEHGGRMAILSAEGGIFDLMGGRYSSGVPNLDVFLAGHAGDPIRVDRKGRPPEYVEHPSLTMALAVQPFVLAKAGRCTEFGGRGLFDRFVFAIPRSNIGYREVRPPPVPPTLDLEYRSRMMQIATELAGTDHPRVLVLSVAADVRFCDWRESLERRRRRGGDLSELHGWAGKLDGTTARIAALLHVADGDGELDSEIGPSIVDAAIAIAEWAIPHAIAAFTLVKADTQTQASRIVLSWVLSSDRTSFNRRECHRALISRFPKVTDLDPALALLELHGWIRRNGQPIRRQAGRPQSPSFTVNPRALRTIST